MDILATTSYFILISVNYIVLRMSNKVLLNDLLSPFCKLSSATCKNVDGILIALHIRDFPDLGIGNNLHLRLRLFVRHNLSCLQSLHDNRRICFNNRLFFYGFLPLVIGRRLSINCFVVFSYTPFDQSTLCQVFKHSPLLTPRRLCSTALHAY